MGKTWVHQKKDVGEVKHEKHAKRHGKATKYKKVVEDTEMVNPEDFVWNGPAGVVIIDDEQA